MRTGFTALALLLAGCAAGPPPPGGSPYDVDSPMFAAKRHYERFASEEGRTCNHVRFAAVTDSAILEDTPEHVVLRVRYYYRDLIREEDDNLDFLTRGRGFRLKRYVCRGYNTRTFTLDKTDGGYRVVAMTGEGG